MSNNALNDLMAILAQVKIKITDGSDMLWGWYETPAQLRNDLECYIRQLGQGDLTCLKELELLFLPTSVLQEHSIQNGWSTEYLALSETFDRLYKRLSH
jgi:hypothetical protein